MMRTFAGVECRAAFGPRGGEVIATLGLFHGRGEAFRRVRARQAGANLEE